MTAINYRSMSQYTITTATDLEDVVAALDMRAEIAARLSDGTEAAVEYRRYATDGGFVELAYFPACGRGAAADGGPSSWTDAGSLDDLADRYADPERWSE